MIEEISIRGLGVIEEATFSPGPGFTALTGETGAGKTMVVTALGLLLGQRADSAVVRVGHENARAEGRWVVNSSGPAASIVREAGGDTDDLHDDTDQSELTISRTLSREGRSRAFAGGCSVPVATLSKLAEHLVVVHGQSGQIRLRSSSAQRCALDRFAGAPMREELSEYTRAYSRWKANSTELDAFVAARDEREQRAETLRFTLADIEAVAPAPREDHNLAERAERIGHSEQLRAATMQARELISGDQGTGREALGSIESARREIERASHRDATLSPVAESLASVGFLLADITAQLARYAASLDADGARELDNIEHRRSELAHLTRKYGESIDDVLTYAEECRTKLADLDGDTDRVDTLATLVAEDSRVVTECAKRVSELRHAAAERLSAEVTGELAALAMPDARLIVSVESGGDMTATGCDDVQIFLQPHPGAEPRPLAKGASGGELSRVMLAIEVVIASVDPVSTFVFDEIDAGVGGAAAREIGARLRKLGESAQVIVVTHLAQVAAFAKDHFVVVKGTDGTVTTSSVRRLEMTEREQEIARLLSGLSDSTTGLAHARELLAL